MSIALKSDNPSFVLHGIDVVKFEDVSGSRLLSSPLRVLASSSVPPSTLSERKRYRAGHRH